MKRLTALNKHLSAGVGRNECSAETREPEIKYEVFEGVIALITINRPKKMNSLTSDTQALYFDLLDKADADPMVKVIVVTGEGRAFCAGADFASLDKITKNKSDDKPKRSIAQIQALKLRKPVIGAINGACAGLGFVLAAMTDIRFAVKGAKITSSFAKRGLVAEHGLSSILPKIVGMSNAFDMLLSSRVILAEEAKEMGFITKVFPDRDTLIKETLRYAMDIAKFCSPAALDAIKMQVYDDLSITPDESMRNAAKLLRQSFKHPDNQEGVKSYVEKRDPDFAGLSAGRIKDIPMKK